jgi:hypothetical protein
MIVAAVAGVAVACGGAAFAAQKLDSPGQRSQAIIDDAAGQLGIQPSKLSDALKKAMEDQIDAAVKSGELTQAQADAMKQRIESGDFPLVGFGLGPFGFDRHFGFGFGLVKEGLDDAASYIGITTAELRSELASGKTLAQIAQAHGKSVDGLVQALVDAAKKQLDAAVSAGKLTQAQEQQLESTLQQRITDLVNGVHPGLPFGGPFHGRFRAAVPGLLPRIWGLPLQRPAVPRAAPRA